MIVCRRSVTVIPRTCPLQQSITNRSSASGRVTLASAALRLHCQYSDHAHTSDPRIHDLGTQIQDEFARIKQDYATPKHPVVLAHGLLGFNELRVAGEWLPAVQYWHGIREALEANGVKVITASVPASASIQERAAKLADDITNAVSSSSDYHGEQQGQEGGGELGVNIIAHSMGGLDARHMISQNLLNQKKPDSSCPQSISTNTTTTTTKKTPKITICSLTTISTPHRGSPFASYLLSRLRTASLLPTAYNLVRSAGLDTDAFAQLTPEYLTQEFNPANPDAADSSSTQYFSYGAALLNRPPPLMSPFRGSWGVIRETEGANDGLVSVSSAKWGQYKGTLVDVSHLDLINWTNRLRWSARRMVGMEPSFNAIAFYLGISDMLAREGL